MCPDLETLSAFLDGEVGEPWKRKIEQHLLECPACQRNVADMRQLGAVLRNDAQPDDREPLARLRGRLYLQELKRAYRLPVWKKRLVVPVPAAAAAALLVLLLGVSTLFLSMRRDFRSMSIRTQPSGTTEVKITAPIQDLEHLLRSLDRDASKQEFIIRLPNDSTFSVVGEPELVREADFTETRRQP